MANEAVLSGNLRLNLNSKTIFDATDCSLTLSRETKQRAATKDTAAGASTKGTRTWTAGYNGLAIHASDGIGTHDFAALFDLWKDDTNTLIAVQFAPDSGDAAAEVYEGNAIITELSGSFNVDEDGTISMTLTGSGEINKV